MKKNKIPTHVGIILDGNGRWATRRGLPRGAGHKKGIEAVKKTVNASLELGIKVLSLFCFSTENWKRDKTEINGIWQLVREYISSTLQEFQDKNIKIRTMGDLTKLPKDVMEQIEDVKEKTKNNNALIVNLAINYGGRADIIMAVNKLRGSENEITETQFLNNLQSAGLPSLDLVIRTSGEMRISGFMLFECAYAELLFPKVLWPNFSKKHLLKAIKQFNFRERRFGGIIIKTKEEKK
ncbi:MAG: polyprenyl diphosphate synthase [Clostridia bacterium]